MRALVWVLFNYLLFYSPSSEQTNPHLELFWNLYSAVVRGSRILHDITEGVGAVTKAIRAIDSFLDIPVEEQIADETDNDGAEAEMEGRALPESSAVYSASEELPTFSGCGALGFHIRDENLPVRKMTECCIAQDTCYTSSCKVSKKECDSKLKSCIFSVCDSTSFADKYTQKNCKSAAKLLFSGTMALSFKQFNDAQSNLDCKGKRVKWKK